ncbi:MAG TPA: ABC transporter ATP-binding protein, partial [Steroidobacteraceae bacterium]|nr:ABC transporter ATP-binding protein [Steroidobacteraceae bacterium]
PPLLIRDIIDHALPEKNGVLLTWLVVGIITSAIVSGVIGVGRSYLATVMGQGVMFDLRTHMYAHLLRQSLKFFTTVRAGEMQSRLQNDVGGVQGVVSMTMVLLVSNAIVVVSTLIAIFSMDWLLAVVATAVLPLFILPARKVGRVTGQLSKDTQERLAEMTATVQETLSINGFLLARLFGTQRFEQQRFADKAGAVRDLQIKQSVAGRWFLMWILLFATIGPALIYLAGGLEVIAGRLTVGTIVAFVSYLGLLYAPVSALVNMHVDIMKAVALFRRIFEYLDLPVEITEPVNPTRIENPRGALRFDSVTLDYGTGATAVNDVSFEMQPGQMVALVGPSGAGKTSLAYLAARLYDPTAGRVTFDGVNLRELALQDLSTWIAMVTQEVTLFNATLEENLRYAKPDATREELEQACSRAQIHDVIAALPQGLSTKVGERGYKLSGGERQRLAIARVLLRNPRLLILDEATSSLDSASEALVQKALEPLLQGRTSLVIAHRLSTILRADMILVLDRGRIVEQGSHAELLARNGLYAKLYNEQFKIGVAAG